MASTPYSKFRLPAACMDAIDGLAASNGGNRSQAIREGMPLLHHLMKQAGRQNADELDADEWTLLGHTQVGSDDIAEILAEADEPRGPGRPTADAVMCDWSQRIALELVGMHEGVSDPTRAIHRDERRAAKRLAKKISRWGVARGYALFAALRYFWRHQEAGIAACAAPEVWMVPTAREAV